MRLLPVAGYARSTPMPSDTYPWEIVARYCASARARAWSPCRSNNSRTFETVGAHHADPVNALVNIVSVPAAVVTDLAADAGGGAVGVTVTGVLVRFAELAALPTAT